MFLYHCNLAEMLEGWIVKNNYYVLKVEVVKVPRYYLYSRRTCFHASRQFSRANPLQKALVFSIAAVDL